MRMWFAGGPTRLADMPCPMHSGAGGKDSGQPAHDHQQCLLCNVGLGAGTLPVVALLAAPVQEAAALLPMPPLPAVRKNILAAAPRGPPAPA
jgi:hypothetical protein